MIGLSSLSAASETLAAPEEGGLLAPFERDGYATADVEMPALLARIRDRAAAIAAQHLGLSGPADPAHFLDHIHDMITPEQLNALRLVVIGGINAEPWFRPSFFALARRAIEMLVGNELAMQRRINLNIQLPGDESSLLPLHTDVWSGDSAFELIVWLPLVDCHDTKSLYIAPAGASLAFQDRITEAGARDAEGLYRAVENDVSFLTVPYGRMLLFHAGLVHGNRVNREAETRWSMNCRFKALLSPYADKRLGEYFEPITMRPVTRLGLRFGLPERIDG